nr:MAG TPA: hypothetical protein [Caudoviricetes sp.]
MRIKHLLFLVCRRPFGRFFIQPTYSSPLFFVCFDC